VKLQLVLVIKRISSDLDCSPDWSFFQLLTCHCFNYKAVFIRLKDNY